MLGELSRMESKSLSELPNDLLCPILDLLAQDSLCSVALVSHRFSELVKPALYRTLCFVVVTDYDRVQILSRVNVGTTMIRDLDALLRTLRDASYLRSYVKDTMMLWRDRLAPYAPYAPYSDDLYYVPRLRRSLQRVSSFDKMIQDLCVLIGESEGIRSLHLSIPALPCQVPYQVPQLTSLTMRQRPHHPVDPIDFISMMRIFTIQSLRELEIQSADKWTYNFCASLGTEPISNIRRLTLSDAGPAGPDLNVLLGWPRALRSLVHEVAPVCGGRQPPLAPL